MGLVGISNNDGYGRDGKLPDYSSGLLYGHHCGVHLLTAEPIVFLNRKVAIKVLPMMALDAPSRSGLRCEADEPNSEVMTSRESWRGRLRHLVGRSSSFKDRRFLFAAGILSRIDRGLRMYRHPAACKILLLCQPNSTSGVIPQ
jgi:hypothetical protein